MFRARLLASMFVSSAAAFLAVSFGVGCEDDSSGGAPVTSFDATAPFDSAAPNHPGDAATDAADGGDGAVFDVPDEACPITDVTSKAWSKKGIATTVRSILIRDTVYAVADRNGTTSPLYSFALATGDGKGVPTQIALPAVTDANPTFLPRLQTAKFDNHEQLFVSLLNRYYGASDGGVFENKGGLVRVGPIDAPLPATAAILPSTQGSVDGVFDDTAGPRVLSWSSLEGDAGTVSTLTGAAGSETLASPLSFPGKPSEFERSEVLHEQDRIVGVLRATNLANPSAVVFSGWPISDAGAGAPIDLPGGYATATVRDTAPMAYVLTSAGELFEVDLGETMSPVGRLVTSLPQGYAPAPGSNARMVYTNGSVAFPAFKDGAPRILRVRLGTGAIEEWIPDAPDAGTFVGWSALAAGHGVVCTAIGRTVGATSSAEIDCACLDGAFQRVP
ncbi:hypothetical protein AKJ09_00436 [Labilithrix luteola]|uniref:Lipoprotein n=1 Tax=Labilithrix luteola TaxID=1391654 RepID=A0A0K1PJT6_9BACT|nr:hypothetical protein [Labilithrix luteola]AKU93772.1 hypothetical protein AKJ09_00436 [Labilithrix luteola]